MKIIKFTSPLPPSVNEYLGKKVAYNPITRKYFVQVYETTKAKNFKKYMKTVIARAVKEYNWEKTEEFEYVVCEVKVFSNTKKKDSDNMFKCLLDSITDNGLVYDDSMIMPRVIEHFIDKNNPRLEVLLRTTSKIGIFKSKQKYKGFLNAYCNNCNRRDRNCSILRESEENRVREEVTIDEEGNYCCSSLRFKK